jgi:Tol biopolymer transport system component
MVFHRRGWRVGGAAGLVVVGLVGVATAWATLLTPEPVVTAKGRQIRPSAALAGAYVAYSQSRPGDTDVFDAYVKPAGRPRFKVNARGQGFAGGIDGTTLVWQSVLSGQSDLRLFDLASHTRSVPTGVNTRRWEFEPTISGDWILYGQTWGRAPNWRVILHNTNTSETRILAERVNRPHTQVSPGQVNGDYATWESINFRTNVINVFVYQISTATTTKLPRPTGKLQYHPSVTPAGTVFYLRSGLGCGHDVLRKYAAGVDTPLARLPRGYDALTNTFAVEEGGGITSVYFDRVQCSTGKSHIYKVTVS